MNGMSVCSLCKNKIYKAVRSIKILLKYATLCNKPRFYNILAVEYRIFASLGNVVGREWNKPVSDSSLLPVTWELTSSNRAVHCQ